MFVSEKAGRKNCALNLDQGMRPDGPFMIGLISCGSFLHSLSAVPEKALSQHNRLFLVRKIYCCATGTNILSRVLFSVIQDLLDSLNPNH